jgi:hypothetical protein
MMIALFGAHFYFDYAGQGDFMARAKNRLAPIPGVPWHSVLTAHAAIQAADLQRSFPQDGDVQRAVRQIGGWQRLGQKNRDLRGQTEQEFLNAYASLPAEATNAA